MVTSALVSELTPYAPQLVLGVALFMALIVALAVSSYRRRRAESPIYSTFPAPSDSSAALRASMHEVDMSKLLFPKDYTAPASRPRPNPALEASKP